MIEQLDAAGALELELLQRCSMSRWKLKISQKSWFVLLTYLCLFKKLAKRAFHRLKKLENAIVVRGDYASFSVNHRRCCQAVVLRRRMHVTSALNIRRACHSQLCSSLAVLLLLFL
jgi:hypothetical protein